ncbi:MAG TPA: bifunctional demethylmenaquinone methyltransferase/2-methoxy-6-polyprenyl-1,4-benzoquinol methylase UbiE [Solirubrobacteraceae bacterium]|jgi:demethylmenaquinone methyltransferase/2-methoxy-6-polyprenyl-1,4-benzoquinol methylase
MSGGSSGTLEATAVAAMFDRIARVYDAMNTVMTAGLHHRWRARTVELAQIAPGSRVLDVATGTGDLARELARAVSPGGEVVGCDFSQAMLARARAKAPEVHFDWADALALPYAGDSFDAATVAFGVRNFSDLRAGLAEIARVVRPGGRVAILEITRPTREPLATFYRAWFDRIVPAIGRLAGDAAAYSYLPSSVRRFPPPRELAAVMHGCGFRSIRWALLAGGIIAIHVGEVS